MRIKLSRLWLESLGLILVLVLLSGCSLLDTVEDVLEIVDWLDEQTSDGGENPVDESETLATSWVALALNLDARSTAQANEFDSQQREPYSAAVSLLVCDTLGEAHQLELYFIKVQEGSWEYHALVDGSELGLTPGRSVEISSLHNQLTFDDSGELASEAGGEVQVRFDGAESQSIALAFGDAQVTTQRAAAMEIISVDGDGCSGAPLEALLQLP